MFLALMMPLFLAAIVILVVLAVRWLGSSGHHLLGGPPGQGQARALDILKERLARGERTSPSLRSESALSASVERPTPALKGGSPLPAQLFLSATAGPGITLRSVHEGVTYDGPRDVHPVRHSPMTGTCINFRMRPWMGFRPFIMAEEGRAKSARKGRGA